MQLKHISLIIFTLFLHNSILAQNDVRIGKKLKKLFDKGKYEKCYKKAHKLNRKHPHSFIPEYYISKVGIQNYSTSGFPENKRYKYLENAVRYSDKLPDTYIEWKNSVRETLKNYVYAKHDSIQTPTRCKKALVLYTRVYKDTITIYSIYFPKAKQEQISEPVIFLSNSDSLRAELVLFARKQEGITYKYAGEKPETGFDCSGFTKYVYGHIGIELPHNAQLQSNLEGHNKMLADAQTGDLVFFGSKTKDGHRTQHAGIIFSVNEGDIKVVHCVSGGVSIDGKDSSWERYWKDKVLFVKTLPTLNLE
ncbi:MAG: hypothetical protein DRJ05_02120 [Bacteroidetes bacterium]|nr:MAG: hypothetical protein DRJ05_02120 [Bacteroidota bacterium]